jgi:hypothetical protein
MPCDASDRCRSSTLMDVAGFVAANWVGFAVGAAGIIASALFYVRGLRLKRPTWSVHTVDLVTKRTAELQGLTISFKGKPVSDLSVSRIMLFNDGKEPIFSRDIAAAAPLALEVPTDVQMLDATLVAVNNEVNRIGVHFDGPGNRALIEFDRLARGNGAVFDVVHYGGQQPTALVSGVVMGTELRHLSVGKLDRTTRVMAWFSGALAISAAAYFVQQTVTQGFSFALVLVGLLFVFIPGAFFLSQFAEHPAPHGLEAYYERRYRTSPPSPSKGASSKGASSQGP